MTKIDDVLDDIRQQIKVDDDVLAEARRRRDAVLQIAKRLPGVHYTYKSGSVAMGVVNHPVNDADGGIVLDRRAYTSLGPDGDDDVPDDIVQQLHDLIGPEIRKTWPNAKVFNMKRGVTVYMNDPVTDDQDPFVDVVVGLDRVDAPGLWIPNMGSSTWDASHPERHVELMLAGTVAVRRARARVVRLAKAWNKQWSEPGLSSFNIVALALESVTEGASISQALYDFFDYAAKSLRDGRTADPAEVSGPIKTLIRKDQVVKRLTDVRDDLYTAMNSSDDDEVAAALHNVFWQYTPEPPKLDSKHAIADRLRNGTPRIQTAASGLVIAGNLKPQRAFGDPRS